MPCPRQAPGNGRGPMSYSQRRKLLIAVTALLTGVVGCGGGSSGSTGGTPPPSPQSSVAPVTVSFANTLVGTTTPAWSITYENDGLASLAITSISASGDYAQSNNCGSSLAAGLACTINVTFTPTTSGTRKGNLQIAGDSPQNVALSGTGVTMHNVELSWTPSSSADVIGYYAYSSSQSGGPYALLNASPSPLPPSFDASIMGGQTWYFVVTAVDASGVESVPSNEFAATVPP